MSAVEYKSLVIPHEVFSTQVGSPQMTEIQSSAYAIPATSDGRNLLRKIFNDVAERDGRVFEGVEEKMGQLSLDLMGAAATPGARVTFDSRYDILGQPRSERDYSEDAALERLDRDTFALFVPFEDFDDKFDINSRQSIEERLKLSRLRRELVSTTFATLAHPDNRNARFYQIDTTELRVTDGDIMTVWGRKMAGKIPLETPPQVHDGVFRGLSKVATGPLRPGTSLADKTRHVAGKITGDGFTEEIILERTRLKLASAH